MRELHRIRRGLLEAGFHEFQRNKFRRVVGSDGLEHGAEFDVFRRYGRRHAKIVVGAWHAQVGICLASILTELNESERARVVRHGFSWLLAHEIDTTDIEQIDMETRQGLSHNPYSVGDMLRRLEPVRSLATVVHVAISDATQWRGWARPNSLLGMKFIIALELLRRRGVAIDQGARTLVMSWIMGEPRYALIGADQFYGMVDRAVLT